MNRENLPEAEIYMLEYKHLPWGNTIKTVIEKISDVMDDRSSFIDLMCGPGYLLGEMRKKFPNSSLAGIDNNKNYVEYGRSNFDADFLCADVLFHEPVKRFDVVCCTGGIHHISLDMQGWYVNRLSSYLVPEGYIIIADPFIKDFYSESERIKNVKKLGEYYIQKAEEVGVLIEECRNIQQNDIAGIENKRSLEKTLSSCNYFYDVIDVEKIWEHNGFGEFVVVMKPDNRMVRI